MTEATVTRRRFIGIVGVAAGMALLPADLARAAAQTRDRTHDWNGVALGAHASIRLVHGDREEAARIIDSAVREIERLEGIFSLYRADSAVSRLNRDGRLRNPPLELVDLLARARGISRASHGAFDLTVQPLWLRYRDHFAADPGVETPPAIEDVLALVDWRGVHADLDEVRFERAGMAVTTNGIAQGYITDRVAELFRRNGVENVALNLGEARTMGRRADGGDWVIGIADPNGIAEPAGRLRCRDRAVATSGGYGTVFDRDRRFGHLIDPRDGGTAPVLRGISVSAAEACTADAWSTALAVMSPAEQRSAAAQLADMTVYSVGEDGRFGRLA